MDTGTGRVQHVPKTSSDELLRKFAQEGLESAAKKDLRLSMRRRRRSLAAGEGDESPSNFSATLVERKSLLPPGTRRSMALIRQLGIGRTKLRARDFKNKSILGAIEKTWHRTIDGASRVFMERHYNRHKRLINDIA